MASIQLPSSADTDPNSWVSCPYDPVHRFPRKRTQYHLNKCRKNHPTAEMATCPFNAIHVMPKPEMRWHLKSCPDKGVIQQDIKYITERVRGDEGESIRGCTALPEPAYELSADDEDWDADEGTFNDFGEIPGGAVGGGATPSVAPLRRPHHLPQVLQQQQGMPGSAGSDFLAPLERGRGRASLFQLMENQHNNNAPFQLPPMPTLGSYGRGSFLASRPPPPGFAPRPVGVPQAVAPPPLHSVDNLGPVEVPSYLPPDYDMPPLSEGVVGSVTAYEEEEEPAEVWD